MKIITVLFGFLLSSQAIAADFMFSVPVKLEHIPKGIAQAKILCEVFTEQDREKPIASGYRIKGIDARQGLLRQDINVPVNLHAMQRQMRPHHYHCQLLLLVPWAQPAWQTPGANSEITALRPQQNSELVSGVSGLIP